MGLWETTRGCDLFDWPAGAVVSAPDYKAEGRGCDSHPGQIFDEFWEYDRIAKCRRYETKKKFECVYEKQKFGNY